MCLLVCLCAVLRVSRVLLQRTLVEPNKCESLAVDARQELDLKVGVRGVRVCEGV